MKLYLVKGVHPYIPTLRQEATFDKGQADAIAADLVAMLAKDICPKARLSADWQEALAEVQAWRWAQDKGSTVTHGRNWVRDAKGVDVSIADKISTDVWIEELDVEAPAEAPAVAFARSVEEGWGEMYDDEDRWANVSGGDAVEWLGYIVEDARKALAAKPKPVRVVVGVDGGLVQGASADAPVELVVADYDVDTFDQDNPPMDVPQSGGDPVDGYLVEHVVTVDPEWVDAVFAANADAVGGAA